ncbi:cysteine-rich motor neuron 1 protein [Patella vulgata]|uniref:cysteine-rich motor neuron 1 protein n=1 Tax=Patella vulgata TaxID=6465 RepID=UPI00217F6F14|nr:cysteine-rich motor neuron 1 protein [Patella vulgata]
MYKGVLIVSLFIALNFNTGACKQGCATVYGPCPGNRPRIPAEEGCCPARVGEACGVDVGVFCDGELGYKCVAENGRDGQGICQGPYKLRRTINEERRLSIKWRAFAPPNYNMEYSLLHRSDNYSTNLSTWNVIECGDEPEYTLTSLKPATWYFIRIGIWSIPFHPDNRTYSNITETLMIKTKDVEYCEHVGKKYEVGEVFNHNNEDRCTCLNTGELVCTSLCPNISNQACEILPGRFDCLEGDCETIQANCSINGSVYIHGEVFEQGCTECQCNNGNATCIVPSNCVAMEPTEACPRPQSHKIEGDCCPTWTCGPSQPTSCTYKGKEYSQGYDWLDEETCEQCQCESGEVACYYFCEEPVLPEDCPRPHRRRAPNGCCEIYECLQPVDICVYANGTFHQGEFLTGNQCELCVCSLNNTVECSPRCREVHLPLPTVVCPKPHIRRYDCCDTLFCYEPEIDIITAIKQIIFQISSPPLRTSTLLHMDLIP